MAKKQNIYNGNSKLKIEFSFLSLEFFRKDVDKSRHSTEPDKARNGISNGIF